MIVIPPRRWGCVGRDEGEATRLGFAHEAGVDYYSVSFTRGERGMKHNLPQKGRSQLFQLNDVPKGRAPKGEVGGAATIKGRYTFLDVGDVFPAGLGVPQ